MKCGTISTDRWDNTEIHLTIPRDLNSRNSNINPPGSFDKYIHGDITLRSSRNAIALQGFQPNTEYLVEFKPIFPKNHS